MGPFLDSVDKFGSVLSRPAQLQQRPQMGPPADIPAEDPATLMGWFSNFGRAVSQRGRNPAVPHGQPTYREGMEWAGEQTLFPGSGTGQVRTYTPEEQAANRAAAAQFGRDVFFGPERGSVIPFVDDASDPERLIRDWGLSEQEFRLSGRAFSEGRLGAGAGWSALATAAAIPVVGWAGRGLAKAGRATARAATSGADVAPVLRAARSGDNILPAVEPEFLSGNVRHTLPESIVQNIPEERRLFAEVLYRQGFSELPEVVSRVDARALAESDEWIPIYRGIRGGEATRGSDIGRMVNAEDAAFDLIHGNLYVASGNAGHGTYFTTNSEWAKMYAVGSEGNLSFDLGTIVQAYIPAGARIVDGGVDSAVMAQYYERYGRNLTGQLDFNTWAAAQGYDAIRFDDTFVVLNRSILKMVEEPIPVSNVGFGATLENRQRFLTARSGGEAAQAAGRERVALSRRFDADDAMYYSDDFDYLRLAPDEVPATAYHVAPRSARESIGQRGLDPESATWNTGAGQNQEWWGDAIWERLGDAGEMIPIEYRPEGVYLFGDLAEAQRYARGGGDIYEVNVRRLVDDGADLIRDPSMAANWEFLDPSEFSYVARLAPEDYIKRIDEVAGTGLDEMIAAERSRIRNVLAPENTLGSGIVVPNYSDVRAAQQAFDEFMSLPPVLPRFSDLNRQWMDPAMVDYDVLFQYQTRLLGPDERIATELAALAHWQYVGNNNIQALLRTGNMPVLESYERAVLDLMGMYQVPRSQIEAVFTARAQEAMPLLDNLIATSNTHGGFVAYRGVNRQSLNAAFGDDFYTAMANDPQSLVGLTWTDSAYSATSLSPTRAREFAWGEKPTPETMGVLFRVTIPNGVGAAPVNGYLNPYSPAFPNEYEMLLGRGSTFRITEVVTPMDQAELINPKWFNTFWDEASGTYAHLRTDTIPVIHIEVIP